MDPDLLIRSEAAALLRVSIPTLDRLARQNKIPVIRIGKSVRFRKSSLQAMLAKLETEPAEA